MPTFYHVFENIWSKWSIFAMSKQKNMKRTALFLIAIAFTTVSLWAQSEGESKPFNAYLYNKEYKVFMRINFYDQNITVPGQELFGQIAGYLSKEGTSYCWLVVDATPENKKARLQMVNDYGSEDLEAELTQANDSVYVLKHLSGSTMKVPNKGKWQKLPHTLELIRK